MNNTELIKYGLISDKETKNISNVTGEKVYRIIGYENMLVSTWDFVRNVTLPEGIWSISKATESGIFQLHVSDEMLTEVDKSIKWGAKLLQLQIYLKKEFNE